MAKELDSKNCKILIKECEDNKNRWTDILCFYIIYSIWLKWTYCPGNLQIHSNHCQNIKGIFHRIRRSYFKISMETKIAKIILKKKIRTEVILCHDFRLYHKAIVSKTACTAKSFDCMDHNKLWKILKEMGIPDHLTCLLRNLFAGQEATVRTGHGTADWFQIGKGVHQGCIMSPC